MTGKEALEYIRVNTRYRYVLWNNSHIKAVEKELEELAKYKMVFEILKDKLKLRTFYIEDEYFCNKKYALHSDGSVPLTKEEYELLEELMNDE